jgi:putative transposase
MDETHLLNAVRYIALKPVRARLVGDARGWPHSSVAARLAGRDDGLAIVRPILDRVAKFADLLDTETDDPAFAPLRRAELFGRPLGSAGFVTALEARLDRRLAPAKRGRRPKGGIGAVANGK